MTSCIFNTGAAPVSNPVFRIRTSQTKLLERVLAKAFYNDPRATYILPDARRRRAAVSWFFASVAIPASRHCGQAYTTVNIDGGALWIRFGNEFTIMRAVWAPMASLLFDLDRSSIARWVNVIGYLELARRSLTDKPYWHLFTLGTNPSENETEIRARLIEPVLAEADLKRRFCYVETFQEKDLLFYQQQGFEIAGAGQIPKGPSFWVLIRRPFPETSCNLGPRILASCKLIAHTTCVGASTSDSAAVGSGEQSGSADDHHYEQ